MDETQNMSWVEVYQQVGITITALFMLCGVAAWLGKKYIATLEENAKEWRADSKTNTETLQRIAEATATQARAVVAMEQTTSRINTTLERHAENIQEVKHGVSKAECKYRERPGP